MRLRRRGRRVRSRRVARQLVLELPRLLGLVFRLLRDRRVSRLDKVVLGLAVAYVVSPVDLLPDFLGSLGLIDDVYVLGLALARLVGRADEEILLEHWRGRPESLALLVEGLDDIGALLPRSVRRALERLVPTRAVGRARA